MKVCDMVKQASHDDTCHMVDDRAREYRPEFARQVEKLCALAATDAEVADFFGIDPETLDQWREEYPEFRAGMDAGQEKANERVKRALYHKAVGYDYDDIHVSVYRGVPIITPIRKHMPPDASACMFWLKNRRPDEWCQTPDGGGGKDDSATLLAQLIEKLPN